MHQVAEGQAGEDDPPRVMTTVAFRSFCCMNAKAQERAMKAEAR
jgi:hypothetical protein